MAVFAPMPSASVRIAVRVKPGDLRSWRKANLRSFILFGPQCDDGIYAAGALRRPPTGGERDQREQDGDGDKRERIGSADAVELAAEQSREAEHERDADDRAD